MKKNHQKIQVLLILIGLILILTTYFFYPNMKKRNQWLYDMSYAEWSLEEMRQGLTWKHLREHIKNASTK